MYPEKMIIAIKNDIKKEWIWAFSGSMLFGLIANIYKMTNWLPNWDSLVFYHSPQNMTKLGRPFLGVIDSLSSTYELPFLNAFIGLLWISIAAICVCEILDIQRPLTALLSGAALATFPTITSTMYYAYTVDGYCLMMLCACIGVLVSQRKKWGFFVTAGMTLIICGTYPAYLSVSAVLWIFVVIKELVFDGCKLRSVILKTLRFVCGVFIGGIAFYALLSIILYIGNIQLEDYQGVGNSFLLTGFKPFYAVKKSCYTFVSFLFCNFKQFSIYVVANVLMVIFLLAFGVKSLFSMENRDHIVIRVIITVLFVMALPAGCCVLYFINTGVGYHSLMCMGFGLIPVFMLRFYDENRAGFPVLRKWAIFGISVVMILNNTVIAHASAAIMETAYERSYSYAVRLADRIDQVPGATEAGKIAIIGTMPDSEYHTMEEYPMITGITDGTILIATDETIEQDEVILYMLRDYTGVKYKDVGKTGVHQWENDPEVCKMPSWPAEGCVKVIGDTVIVKLEESKKHE